MKKLIPTVIPNYLLLICGVVWLTAGGNILRIGVIDFMASWNHHWVYFLESALIFFGFMKLIFYPLVQKHQQRIAKIHAKKVAFYLFFDKKGYVIMIGMITSGLFIRKLQLLPGWAIGVFYCGLGLALVGAGLLFLKEFGQTFRQHNQQQETAEACRLKNLIKKEQTILKKYITISFIYAIAAMLSGVFYREFTKIFDFFGNTTLAFTHLHLFALGSAVFLMIAIFSIITNVEQQKQFKLFLIFYNIGLPFMVLMLYVRGILQVLEVEISRGLSAAISGVSGISHILLAVGIVLLFLAFRKSEAAFAGKLE